MRPKPEKGRESIYYSVIEKIMVLVTVVIVFLLLGYGIYYSIIFEIDPFITVVLAVVFAFMVPISVFMVDLVFYKGGG
ncbi:MAG: hypothetical protein ISS36_01685 [Candidatus Aenigmarchaeota archaeon]|nr:hypothetical protein [Candidatus Aenigmarchaeota archaeon]